MKCKQPQQQQQQLWVKCSCSFKTLNCRVFPFDRLLVCLYLHSFFDLLYLPGDKAKDESDDAEEKAFFKSSSLAIDWELVQSVHLSGSFLWIYLLFVYLTRIWGNPSNATYHLRLTIWELYVVPGTSWLIEKNLKMQIIGWRLNTIEN